MCVWYVSPLCQFNDTDKFVYGLFGDFTRWAGVNRQQIISIDKDMVNCNITITAQGFSDQTSCQVFSVFNGGLAYVSCGTSDTTWQARFFFVPHNIICA
jgi:hypothetical protein